MDHTRVYKIGNGAYYRSNFMPSQTTRQILEERLNARGRGISTSSNSSWNFSNSYLDIPKSRKGKLWGLFLMVMIFIVVLVVSGVAALALYMGAIRTDSAKNIIIFQGSLRITGGDEYQEILSNHSSKDYVEKANKYSVMMKTILQKTLIGPALKEINIIKFENGSLIVHFRIHLDRRKIPEAIKSVEDFLRRVLTGKMNWNEFKNLKPDKRGFFIKRFVEDEDDEEDMEEESYTHVYKTINRTKTKKTERKTEIPRATTPTSTTRSSTSTTRLSTSTTTTTTRPTAATTRSPTTTTRSTTTRAATPRFTTTTTVTPPVFEIVKTIKHFEPTTVRSETSTRIKFRTNTKLSQKINEIFRTEKPMNGHARPVSTSTEMLNLHTDEPWRPILLTTAINSLETENPIKFTKKEPIKIVPENITQNIIIPTEENPKKSTDPLGIEQMLSGIKQVETTTTSKTKIVNPFEETDNSRSSNIMNFDLPIVNQFTNLENLFNGFTTPTRFPVRTKVKEMTTEESRVMTLLPVRSNINMQRPLRRRPNRKSKYVIYVREIGKRPRYSKLVMTPDDYDDSTTIEPEVTTDYVDLETTTVENENLVLGEVKGNGTENVI